MKDLSKEAQELKLGVYKHFKGSKYRVTAVARNSENPDEEMVVYENLENGNVWVRPLKMFTENVNRDGYDGPRFKYVSE